MKLLKAALFWIKGNLIKLLAVAVVLLFAIVAYLFNQNDYLKHDRNRIEENFMQVTQTNAVLNVTLGEYQQMQTRDKAKLDSLFAAVKIKPKTVRGATVINTVYKDTVIEKIVYLPAIQQPDKSFKIPVSTNNGCWGMKGQILSNDQNSKLEITEKTATNSHQLVVTKKKRFLFWTIRPEKYRLFNDCGEGTFTQINFIKK
ncbi:MAG TPA: hypothetical protein DCR40_10360 [Prolixibacteraceae bacterium]|nr:hypothetical protein [Prolixibacteraceae bacterium]